MAILPSAQRRLRQLTVQLMHLLRTWPWFDTLRTLRLRFREDRLGLTAGSLTFTTLVSIVPLFTLMLALFTAFPVFAKFQSALQQYLLQSLVPDSIARPVLQTLTSIAGKARGLGSAGLIALAMTALALMFTIDRTLNGLWRVPRPRPWAQRLLIYWTGLTLGPLLLGISLSLTSYAVSASRGLVEAVPGGVAVLLGVIEFGLIAGGAAGLYRFVPNTHVRWAHAWAGGLFVAVGFELAKAGLAWYVASVKTFSVLYGALAALPILLLWIYLVWVIVLLGAVIAAYAPSLALRVVRLPERPGHRFALALAVVRELAQVRGQPPHGLALVDLAGRLRIDPLQVEPVVETLHQLDWCGRLDDEGDPRHVLLIEPETTMLLPLVDRLLLHDQMSTAAFRRQAGLDVITVAEAIDGQAAAGA